MCIFKSMISLKMLLKQPSEPVCSIQHQSKYWHNSENVIHPFVERECGHCSQSRTSGVPAGNFHWDHQILSCPSPHDLSWSGECSVRKLGKVILGSSNCRGSAGLACLARCAARHVCCLAEMLCSQKSVYCFSKCLLFL